MRRPSGRRLLLGVSYLPALYIALDQIMRRRRGAHGV
jgi:hypothetical protein